MVARKMVAAVVLAAAMWGAGLCAMRAAAAEQYTFIVPLAEGFSYGAMENILKDVGKLVSAKTGINVAARERKYKHGNEMSKIVLEEFNSGKGHFAFIYSQDYVRMAEMKAAAAPMFSFTINNKTTSQVCAFVRAADGIKTVAQLKGKNWGMNGLLQTYWLLNKAGIKDDPKKFFASMKYMDDSPATKLLDAVLAKKIDVFVSSTPMDDMAMNNDVKYSKGVAKVGCVDYDHNLLFVASKKTPKDVVDKVAAAFLGAHKDKAFQNLWFLFKAIKGHFVAYTEDDMAGTKELVKLATKNGWYEKDKAFIKDNMGK